MQYWLILGSAVGFGMSPMLVQILLANQFQPEVIALYRFTIPFLLVLPHLKSFARHRAEYLRSMAIGAFAAIGMVCYFSLFQWMPASTLILIYYTYPLFAILIGVLFFGTPATRNRFIASALILLAVFLTLDMQTLNEIPMWALSMSVLAPISFALLINYFAQPKVRLNTGQRMSASLAGNILVLIPLALFTSPVKWLPADNHDLIWIASLGLLSAAIPQYFFTKGSLQAGMESTTMIGSTEIIFAMILGALILGEPIDRNEILAAALIVLASLVRLESPATPRGTLVHPVE